MDTRKQKLNMAQKVQLIDWIRANWKDFEGQSDDDFAMAAKHALGFPIVASTMRTSCAVIGLKRQKARRVRADKGQCRGPSRSDFLALIEEVRLCVIRQGSGLTEKLDGLAEDYRD